MSDLLKITAVFVLILVLLRRKLHVGVVLLISSCVLALLYAMGLPEMFRTISNTVLNEVTIKLLLSLSFIRIFEIMLREQGVMSGMMYAVKGFFRNRKTVIVSMPMLIGMLPSLGGAYFSAPMVKEATTGIRMSQEEKAFINYWFRHPWEYILPLYPGILLASAISNIPLYSFIAANLAYAVVLLLMGFLYSMKDIDKRIIHAAITDDDRQTQGQGKTSGVWSFAPVLVVIFLVMVLRIELHLALFVITAGLFLLYRYKPRDVVRLVRYGFAFDVLLLIAGVMLFKETMEASGAVKNLSRFFVEQGIPVLPVLCLLPFLTGLLTGVTVGFVGSTFPLILNIAGQSLPYMSLAFASGFAGVLLSPVHVCLILTREYFHADLWGVYKRVIPASACILLAAFIEYLIVH